MERRALVHEPRADRSTEIAIDEYGSLTIRLWIFDDKYESTVPAEALGELMALANDALSDLDARKITPRIVRLLRRAVVLDPDSGQPPSPDALGTGELHSFAAALEALLPPPAMTESRHSR
jgi:hypothetical protein